MNVSWNVLQTLRRCQRKAVQGPPQALSERFQKRLVFIFFKFVVAFSFIFASVAVYATPKSLNFQARIKKPDGKALESSSVNFRFTYLDEVGTCVLYSEDFSGVNLPVGGGGLVNIALGTGSRVYPAVGSEVLYDIFSNSTGPLNCQSGSVVTPIATDRRSVVMQFSYSGSSGWQTLAPVKINSVPYAMYSSESLNAANASSLGGVAASAYTKKTDFTTCTGVQVLTFDGTSFSCTTPSGGTVATVTASAPLVSSGGANPNISLVPASGTASGYLSSADWSTFNTKLSSANNLSDLASATTARTNLGLGTAAVLNVAVSGDATAGQIVKGDDSRLLNALQSSSSLSGDVTGTISATVVSSVGGKTAANISTSVNETQAATSNNTGSTIVRRNASGDFTAGVINATTLSGTNVSATNTSTQNLYLYDALNINRIIFKAPSAGITNYTLTLPATAGTNGQVLSTNASGDLSWVNAAAGSVTSVTANAPLSSSGGATPAISITKANGTTDGYLASTDWTVFNDKLGTSSIFSGDISGTSSTTSVDKIKGTAVSGAATTAGQFLVYNGTTQYAPTMMSGDATMSSAGVLTLANTIGSSGTSSKVTYDEKGRITAVAAQTSADITTALAYTPVNKAGDTMTGALNLPSNGLTVGTNQLAVSGGKVGVGTASPATLLDVGGDLSITQQTTAPSSTNRNSPILTFGGRFYDGTFGQADQWTVQSVMGAGANPTSTLTFQHSGSLGVASYAFLNGKMSVGIASADGSAALDVTSTTAGVLIPRMTTVQRDAIGSPAAGLQVYNTTTNALNYHNGTGWQALGIAGSGLSSLNGLTAATQTFAVGSAGSDINISSATSTHTFNFPTASAANRGVLSSSDWTVFNDKLGTSSTFSGDVSGTSSTTSVDKIKGTAISGAATTAGQFLVYNGTTQYVPVVISGDATMASDGTFSLTNSGVTAGIYSGAITVDAKGRVTSAAASLDLTSAVSGVLAVSNGGTGIASYATGDILYASGATTLSKLPAGSNGQVLTLASGIPSWSDTGLPTNSLVTYQVRVATKENITLSGTQTIDSVAVVAGDRVLVKNQTAYSENGVYIVAAGAWSRATDMNTWAETLGYRAQIIEGGMGKGMTYQSATSLGGTLGVNAIWFNSMGASNSNGNMAIGSEALNVNGGIDNTALGFNALFRNTNGGYNTATGSQALYSNTTGQSNTGMGYYALYTNSIGENNSAVGGSSLWRNTIGNENTAMGSESLANNIAKDGSTAIGFNSMRNADNTAINAVSYNTALGAYSLQGSITPANNTGTKNTALGHSSLIGMTSGSNNIGIGYNSGSAITTGSNNIVIGSNTGSTIATSSNNILIADGAGNERVRIDSSGNFGIGTSTPGASLDVKGAIRLSGATSGYAGFKPAAAAGSTVWTLPVSDGTSGQVLTTNGSGDLSWVNATAGSVTSVTANAPLSSSGGATPAISITKANGTTDGYLASTDWTTFNDKLGTSSTFSGDLSGTSSTTSVDKIKGTAVSGAATTAGQFLVYNGTTQYVPAIMSGDATMSSAGILTLVNTIGSSGTSSKVTYDEKGRITAVASQNSSDITTALSYTPVNKAGDTMAGALNMGGNTIYGNSTSGGSLNLESTSHATKGNLILGSTTVGKVGIGTASPSAKLSVNASAATSLDAFFSNLTGTAAGTYRGANIYSGLVVTTAASTVVGARLQSYTDSAQTGASSNIGAEVIATSDHTVSTLKGISTSVTGDGFGFGSIPNITGIDLSISTGSTVTDQNGLKISQVNNGTITNRYGIQISTPTGTGSVTNDYGLYQAASTQKNYFAGDVGIGTTTPDTKLEIYNGDSTVTGDNTWAALWARQYSATKHAEIVASRKRGSYGVPAEVQSGDILGSLSFRNSSSNEGADVRGIATENHSASAYGAALGFYTIGNTTIIPTEKMRIDQNGNVGIGTTSPTAVLHLKAGTATASTAPLKLTAGTNLTTPEAGAIEYDGTNLFYTDGTATRRTIASTTTLGSYLPLGGGTMTGALNMGGQTIYGSAAASGDLTLNSTTHANKGNILMSTTGGKVAIGPLKTNPPGATLSVSKTAAPTTLTQANEYLHLGGEEQSNNSYRVIGFGYKDTEEYSPVYLGFLETSDVGSGVGDLVFGTRAVTTDVQAPERMRITKTGNVGIGTTNPTAKLEVQGQILSQVYNAGASTTIDWNNGNMQYTSASCGAFTFSNMLEGGSYTLVVTGATAATCTFSQTSPDTPTAWKFLPANGNTTASTESIYSFVRAGNKVYVSWMTGY